MNYIELLGLPGSGKTFYKKNFQKNKNFYNMKFLLIKFFLSKKKLNFKDNIKIYLLLFLNLKLVQNYKNISKAGNLIIEKKNKILFKKKKRSIILKLIDTLNLNKLYDEIIIYLSNFFHIEKDDLIKILFKEIEKLNQNQLFKDKIRYWITENFLIIQVLKKSKNWNCIMDEGLLYRIFLIFLFTNNKDLFISKVLKCYSQYGKIIIIDTENKKINFRSNLRKKKFGGYVYKNFSEVVIKKKYFYNFLKKIQNKIVFTEIKN